ncbi:MAG: DNA polymerase Y family protein [Methylophilaceae bacterium]
MTLRALYVDFNSYFASVEQQLRPELRGRPVAVLPVVAETTCCIAASYDAKAFGVKTGTRVSDARLMCPEIIFVEARAHLYIEYHHQLVKIVESCTHVEKTLSIDEMVCKLTGSQQKRENAIALAHLIKKTIAEQVGEHIRSSIGIAPNTFLAKVASNMQKPDGCVVIEAHELPEKLYPLKLGSLNGIGRRMEERLNRHGIDSVQKLYSANRQQLRSAWGSVEGERFYDKLRGLELYEVTNDRSSLGHSHVLPPELRTHQAALSVLHRLLQKACMRLRSYKLHTSVISVRVKFLNRPTWVAESGCSATDDTLILTHALEQLWQTYPKRKAVPYAVGISFTGLGDHEGISLDLFKPDTIQSEKLNTALDNLNMRYGKNTVYFGGAHNALSYAPLRIAFNHIPDLDIENHGTKEK